MAWTKIAALGLVACGVVVGCTVTTDDGSKGDGGLTEGDSSAGGKSGSGGGSSAGGKATGGGSSTGGKATGGGAATGGKTGAGGAGGTNACKIEKDDDDCGKCVKTKCCTAFAACTTDACAGDGTDAGIGELSCFHECMRASVLDAGTADQDTVAACTDQCATGGVFGDEAQEVVTCILGTNEVKPDGGDAGTAGCGMECYTVDLSGL